MISPNKAAAIVNSRFKENKPKEVYDFDRSFYIVVAPVGKEDYNDPFFLVHKESGAVRFFNPLEDIDAFGNCMDSGPILTI